MLTIAKNTNGKNGMQIVGFLYVVTSVYAIHGNASRCHFRLAYTGSPSRSQLECLIFMRLADSKLKVMPTHICTTINIRQRSLSLHRNECHGASTLADNHLFYQQFVTISSLFKLLLSTLLYSFMRYHFHGCSLFFFFSSVGSRMPLLWIFT